MYEITEDTGTVLLSCPVSSPGKTRGRFYCLVIRRHGTDTGTILLSCRTDTVSVLPHFFSRACGPQARASVVY